MADPLIAVNDIERFALTDLTPRQLEVAEHLIAPASAIVRGEIPGIDARLASGGIDADLVAYTVAQMVLRVVRDPNLLKSETVASFGYERVPGAIAASLFLTADEAAKLSPPSASLTHVGSVRLGVGLGF